MNISELRNRNIRYASSDGTGSGTSTFNGQWKQKIKVMIIVLWLIWELYLTWYAGSNIFDRIVLHMRMFIVPIVGHSNWCPHPVSFPIHSCRTRNGSVGTLHNSKQHCCVHAAPTHPHQKFVRDHRAGRDFKSNHHQLTLSIWAIQAIPAKSK